MYSLSLFSLCVQNWISSISNRSKLHLLCARKGSNTRTNHLFSLRRFNPATKKIPETVDNVFVCVQCAHTKCTVMDFPSILITERCAILFDKHSIGRYGCLFVLPAACLHIAISFLFFLSLLFCSLY